MQGLRVTGSYDRDSRDNKTPVRSYPIVTTDMIVGATPHTTRRSASRSTGSS